MKKKYLYISDLAKETAGNIVKNGESWTGFLATASRLYKYPFHEQMLIYAQRPDATACAGIEIWNEKMNCWVNKGAKGIALIDEDAPTPRLKYVFDVADVHKARRIGRDPYLWELREEHTDAVMERLEKIYGSTDQTHIFEDRLLEIAARIALDCYEEVAGDLQHLTEGSFMEGLDSRSLKVHLGETLHASIAYTLLARCGANAGDYLDFMNFEHINEFNTVPVLSQLGSNTTELCKPVLMEIGKAIRAYERKNFQKPIDNTPNIDYNTLKRESEKLAGDSKPKDGKPIKHAEERSSDYGNDISEERRLLHPEYPGGRAEGRDQGKYPTDEIRDYAKELPEGEQEGDLFEPAIIGRADGAPAGNTRGSRTADGDSRQTDGGERGSGRGAESKGPDEMDRADEQYQAFSRRNRPEGNRVPLNNEGGEEETASYQQINLFPSMEEQIGNIALDNAEEKFTLSNANLISDTMVDYVLLSGGGQKNSRSRIVGRYQKGLAPETMAEFLRQEYKTGGKGFTFENEPLSIWYDDEGMKLSIGNAARFAPMRILSWKETEGHIRQLVTSGKYMEEAEMRHVPEQEMSKLVAKLYFFFRDEYGHIPDGLEIYDNNYPESKKKLTGYLSNPEGIEKVLSHMDKAMGELERGEAKPRSQLIYRPEGIRESVVELKKEAIQLPAAENVAVPYETFITQDEIDYMLSEGNPISDGLFQIFEFFLNSHDKKEQAEFLKSEYGIGGRFPALEGADYSNLAHDAKGLRLSKGSICEPMAEILLTWQKVAERIRKLMETDRLLSTQAKEDYKEWKREKEQEKLERAKRGLMERAEEEPEADSPPAENFQIANNALGVGTARQKFDQNVAAIHTLQLIESEGRAATPEEQEILSRYAGWGGLPEAFDEKKSSWRNEYLKLKNLLGAEEYASARESTLNAHYTSPTIISSIYAALGKMGFEKGNLLEPSLGTGNFFGMLPSGMQDSRLYGVELDALTGRIARQLYPKADIKIEGFEETDYPNNFFDVVVGNVPFGQYKVADRLYDKHNFLIHDYFLAKALDKVRAGGVVAVVTSKGTMDKKGTAVRKYLAQRAELIGAVRLPNTAFKENAGTEVTSDILFFQKRDRMADIEPGWVHLAENEDGIAMNRYFIDHPEMVVGKMKLVPGPYGMETTCQPVEGRPFAEQLKEAVGHIHGKIEAAGLDELEDDTEKTTIPADPEVKNYSYTVVDGEVYYRENSVMRPVDVPGMIAGRIKGMVEIRNVTSELIHYQLEEYGDAAIKGKQGELSRIYDAFTKEHGLINSQANKRAFNQDSSYCLLCSLEILNEDGTLNRKADMFTKRTIKRHETATSVDTASEALAVSMSEKAGVDLGYMAGLTGKSQSDITGELAGVIFQDPLTGKWETADGYLSGNVREKLELAREYAKSQPEYAINVEALERMQPKLLDASEIEVRLGANWVDKKYINSFMHEIFGTPRAKLKQEAIGVQYSNATGQWNIRGKGADYGNPLVETTFGTSRANAYKILEDSLNLRDSRIFDTVYEDGKEKRVLNKKETMLASQKQDTIREAFKGWIFRDAGRREDLCERYNELFNSNRPREYDGSHLAFPGMTPDITLQAHQKNAVAHVLYGNNTLLAHCVGAGKTYEMAAAAMECRRLKLSQKPLFVVPNHLTEQWASDFLRLYPGANILAATKKDFEPANRKKFCSRIATGDYDGIIIGHSQFEKIALSKERQEAAISRQIDEIAIEIESLKASNGERYTIKQMEKTKKALSARLAKLNDGSRKDDVVTFGAPLIAA